MYDGWVSAMCLDNNTLYTASWDSSIRVWNLNNINNPLYALKGHSNDIESYSVSSDKQNIILGKRSLCKDLGS
ncbi:hypothetical protein [Candidatus Uabimicrobium sp. HlEnr_7]|uniref:hypothetical protein n=1 Tax=Candidatus Uabimicrobium helgolandensis TaxID=3095367 RepID=UPI00355742E6